MHHLTYENNTPFLVRQLDPIHSLASFRAHHIIAVLTFAHIIITPSVFYFILKFICSTNPFLHSLSDSFWTAFTDLEP